MRLTQQQEDRFHHREWAMQRVGWVIIAAIVVLALAGLFGDGPLSDASVSSREAGSIAYERYTRDGARTTLTITPSATALQGNVVRVAIPSAYLQSFSVEEITPEPTQARMSGEDVIYEFTICGAGSSISLLLMPEKAGRHGAQIVIGSAEPLAFSQFTYP